MLIFLISVTKDERGRDWGREKWRKREKGKVGRRCLLDVVIYEHI